MPNAKDLQPDRITSLIIGPGKSGKTYAMRTWAKLGPMMVFNFDGGIAALAGEDADYEVFMDADRYKPSAYTNFVKRWDEVMDEMRTGKKQYKTLALDGLTFLSRWTMNHNQYLNRTIDKPPGYEGYRMLKDKIRDVIMKAKVVGVHIVATVNDTIDKDETTGEISRNPDIEGSYRGEIATDFDFVVYSKVGRDVRDPKKPKYYWQTVPDHQIKSAGLRWECGLLPEEEPDFNVVLRKIEARYPHVKQEVIHAR